MTQPLLIDRRGGTAWLTINRPQAGNAIDLSLARALLDAAILCDEDSAVRCVVVTGMGRMFCAGGDVRDFAAAGGRVSTLIKHLTAALHVAISRLLRMAKPLITVVNGPVAGAGFGLALAGDIVLAARSAHFTSAYTAIGLSPDAGLTWMLPRLVGLRRAQDILLTNRRVTAQEAADLGIVTQVINDDDLAAEAEAMAMRLCRSATGALGRTRNLLLGSYSASLEGQMESEARAVADCARGEEAQEGVAAFFAKRYPKFSQE